jgi:hypothetical protein
MKTRKTIFGIFTAMALAIVTISIIASCNNGDKETHTHTWGAWQETKAPTVTAEGEETRTCAACGEKETRPIPQLPITRTFTITGFAKPITVKDMRTGADDTDLQELGVIAKLENGLKVQPNPGAFNAIQYSLVIEVEKTIEYNRFQARSGNRMGANIDYILSDDINFEGRLESCFNTMKNMTPDEE